jgi:hypothetical protein
MATESFDSWALVELMGHQRIAGRVTEAEIGGCKFVRVDVPEMSGVQALTKYLGPASIYAITPMTEETARALASRIEAAPVTLWDAQRLVKLAAEHEVLTPPRLGVNTSDDDEEEEGDDDDIPFSESHG